ncbi:hypothetical protein PENTCL1PPCAC_11086, partial [Pristionchus entomophagus]
ADEAMRRVLEERVEELPLQEEENAAQIQEPDGRQEAPNDGIQRNQLEEAAEVLQDARGILDQLRHMRNLHRRRHRGLLENDVEMERMNGRLEELNDGEEGDQMENNVPQPGEQEEREERIALLEHRIAVNNARIEELERQREEEEQREGAAEEELRLNLMRHIEFLQVLLRVVGIVEEEREGEITEEMIREAQSLRVEDEKNLHSSIRYSRDCSICSTVNPTERAVYNKCGHVVCYPCAVDKSKDSHPNGICSLCQSMSRFVKLFEEECELEQKKEVINENLSKIVSEEDEKSNLSLTGFSRHCFVCVTENPRQRAVYTHCGHIICYPCAVDNARNGVNRGKCVFCRSKSDFIKLSEQETGGEGRSLSSIQQYH